MSEMEVRPDRPGDGAPAIVAQRVQFRFSKGPAVRFISHLDMMRAFERAMRRARLPFAFSQGYNPRPRISLYVPLPVGATSDAELGSVDVAEPLRSGEFTERLNAVLPPAIRILGEEFIPFEGPHAASRIDTAEYRVEVATPDLDAGLLAIAVDEFCAAGAWPFVRKSEKSEKTVDLRPPVLALELLDVAPPRGALRMEINIGGEGGARPREIVAALARRVPGLEDRRVHRTALRRRAE